MKIGIIGNGFVGKATQILECPKVKVFVYDVKKELCQPENISLEELVTVSDLIFISVPTPMDSHGSCYLGILESVVEKIAEYIDLSEKHVIIRSTVPPGISNMLHCYFMPEFLTVKNFEEDFRNNQKWIFGLKNDDKNMIQNIFFKEKIKFLIDTSHASGKIKHSDITFMENNEAEMVKMFRNAFLAVKVSFCNEMFQFCENKNINYENVRKVACLDERIGESHSYVPGHDGKKGYGGTCFPKDVKSLHHEMKKMNMKSYIIKSSIKRNENMDRI